MTQVTIKITGSRELLRALDGNLKMAMRRAAYGVAGEARGHISQYPAMSEANQPRTFRSVFGIASRKAQNSWYERGFGQKWARKDGGVGGYKSSERMDAQWGIAATQWGALVGNKATYSPVVHHHAEQAGFHKRRGWRTDKETMEYLNRSGLIDKHVKMAVGKVLGRGGK